MFCDNCNDLVKAVYPMKIIFHDGSECALNICLDCFDSGEVTINLKRKHLVSKIKKRLAK